MVALVEMLGDRDVGVRLEAIYAVASSPKISGEQSRVLAQGLKDESAENRTAVIRRLMGVEQGLDPFVPMLLQLAEHDPDPSTREACINTLSYAFKPPAVTAAVVPDLTKSLKSPDLRVRSQAAAILGELKTDARAAIPELLLVLNEPFDTRVDPVRGPSRNLDPASEAATALGRIATGSTEQKEVVAALTEVARSGPLSRQGWAAVALGEFGPDAEAVVPVLIEIIKEKTADDKFERRSSAAQALSKIAPGTPSADQAVAALLPSLESKVWYLKVVTMQALGRFGPKAAAAIPMIRALKEHPDIYMSDVAGKALLAIESKSAP